jgi:hypothetical protein
VSWILVVDAELAPATGAEVEAAWNEWYDREHLPSILGCPGFISGERYRGAGEGRRYLTVYAVSGPACLASEEFAARRGWGNFSDVVSARVELFELVAA